MISLRALPLLVCLALWGCGAGDETRGARSASASAAAAALALPLAFEPREDGSFVANAPGAALVLEARRAQLHLAGGGRLALDLRNAGTPRGERRQPGVVHRYRGGRPARVGVRTFGRVRYPGAWPGIDVVFHGDRRAFEYDLEVAPGADPARARLRLQGGERPRLDAQGRLVIDTAGGPVVQRRPVAFQGRRAVPVRYVLRRDGVGLDVGSYDREKRLVIDPEVVTSSYAGGSGDDTGLDVAVAPDGTLLVAGRTTSADLPGAMGSRGAGADAFVTRLSADGRTRISTTTIGGSGTDNANGVAGLPNGGAVVVGDTASGDLPVPGAVDPTANGALDGWLATLAPDGRLVRATYEGGGRPDGLTDVDVGSAAEGITAVGSAQSSDLATAGAADTTVGGGSDAFVVSYASDLSTRTAATYAGGSGSDTGAAIVRLPAGRLLIGGASTSTDLPGAALGAQPTHAAGEANDGFLLELPASLGAITSSTYIGGSGTDLVTGLARTAGDDVVVGGLTTSTDLPATGTVAHASPGQVLLARYARPATRELQARIAGDIASGVATGPGGLIWLAGTAGEDADLQLLSADGARLVDRRALGGSGTDRATAVATTAAGNAVLTGSTTSNDLPVLSAVQERPGGGTDAFVTLVDRRPDTTLTTRPAARVRGDEQQVVFRSSTQSATFACAVDGTETDCTSPFTATGLEAGAHTITVTAIDRAGQRDGTPATASFEVYATSPTPPDTVITTPPPPRTTERRVSVGFEARPAEPGLGFRCRVDGGAPADCVSPFTTPELAPGAHTVEVALIDAGGVEDPTPAVAQLEVLASAVPAPAPTAPPVPGVELEVPVARIADRFRVVAGRPFAVDASLSSGQRRTYTFDLDGDGAYETDAGTSPTVQHVASAPGTSEIGVRVAAPGGVSTARAQVVATAPLTATGSVSRQVVRRGSSVTFTQRTGVGGLRGTAPSYFTYDPGDGTQRNARRTIGGVEIKGVHADTKGIWKHTYKKPGTYHYTMVATGDQGQMQVTAGEITVLDTGGQSPGYPGPDIELRYDEVPQPGVPWTVDLDAGEIQIGTNTKFKIDGKLVPQSDKTLKKGTVVWKVGGKTYDTAADPTHRLKVTPSQSGDLIVKATYTRLDGGGSKTIVRAVPVRDRLCHGQTTAFAGDLRIGAASGTCLVPQADGAYAAEGGVVLGGMRITAHGGAAIVVVPETGAILLRENFAPGAGPDQRLVAALDGVPFAAVTSSIVVPPGKGRRAIPALTTKGDRGLDLGPLPIVGTTASIAADGATALVMTQPPPPFKETATKVLGAPRGANFKQSVQVNADGTFKLAIPDIQFGPVRAYDILLEYDQGGWLRGGGNVEAFDVRIEAPHIAPGSPAVPSKDENLPPLVAPSGFGISPQGFQYAGLAASFKKPLNILGVLGLKRISAGVEVDPFYFRGTLQGVIPADPKVATLSLCVQIEQVKPGQKTVVCPLVEDLTPQNCKQKSDAWNKNYPAYLHADLCKQVRTFDTETMLLHVRGAVDVYGIPFTGFFEYLNSTKKRTVEFGAGLRTKFAGLVKLDVDVGGFFQIEPKPFRWEIYGRGEVEIAGFLKEMGEVIANDELLAGCATAYNLQGAFVRYWKAPKSGSQLRIFGDLNPFTSEVCNLKKEYSIKTNKSLAGLDASPLRAAQVQRAVPLPAGRKVQVSVRGVGGPPQVELIGPGGQRIVDDGRPLQQAAGHTIGKLPGVSATQIGIARIAKAGDWTVRALPGSPAIADVQVASVTPPARILTVARRRGRQIELRYDVEPRPGRVVRFFEQRADGKRFPLGRAAGRRGALRFTPELGRAGRRGIIAVIEQGGAVQEVRRVDRFTAPRAAPLARPARVSVRRRGRNVLVTWPAVAGATGFTARVRGSDGRDQRLESSARSRRVLVRDVGPTTTLRLDVMTHDLAERSSAPRTARVRASSRAPRTVLTVRRG